MLTEASCMSSMVDSLPVPIGILKSIDTVPSPWNSKWRFTCAVFPLQAIVKLSGLSLMVNPFRKSLVTGISKLTRSGLTSLMYRHRPSVSGSPLMVEHQPMIDRLDVAVGRIRKGSVGQIYSLFKETVANVFVHPCSVPGRQGRGNSYFPSVVFVHGETLSRAARQRNTEIFSGSR